MCFCVPVKFLFAHEQFFATMAPPICNDAILATLRSSKWQFLVKVFKDVRTASENKNLTQKHSRVPVCCS